MPVIEVDDDASPMLMPQSRIFFYRLMDNHINRAFSADDAVPAVSAIL